MYTLLVALLLLEPTFGLYAQERRGKYTIHRRIDDDTGDVFPFPANQSSIVDASTEPVDLPPQDLTVTDNPQADSTGQIPRAFVEKKCDADKKATILSAWDEAGLLADAQTNFRLGYNYDIPHTQWLGKDWNSESSWIPWKWNYRKLIGDNFRRLRQMFGEHAQSGEYIYWYCYDYSNLCTPGVYAYSWDSFDLFWSNHFTVFCPPFYRTSTLHKQVAEYEDDQYQQRIMENFHLNQGQVMLHEVYHYKNLVSDPRTDDYAYQAEATFNLSRDRGTSWAYVNADSYALDAVAIYVQQHYKSSMSPLPFREVARLYPDVAAAVSEPQSVDAVGKTFDQTPPGWTGPLVNDDKPDLTVWDEVTNDLWPASSAPTSTQAATPVCTGSATKWAPRDPLNSAIPTFCTDAVNQGVQDKDSGSIGRSYLSGADVVNLSIDWPSGDPWKPTQDECVQYLTAIMDGCDADASSNPMNWKHGGYLTSGVAKFNIMPQIDRKYVPGTCSFHLHEEEYWSGTDEPGYERTHKYYLRDEIKDGSGAVVSSVPSDVGFGDGSPYVCNSFYAPLEMTPEAQSGDYIQFTIGSLPWTTKDSSGQGRCNVGGWDSKFSPIGRDLDCFLPC